MFNVFPSPPKIPNADFEFKSITTPITPAETLDREIRAYLLTLKGSAYVQASAALWGFFYHCRPEQLAKEPDVPLADSSEPETQNSKREACSP